MVTFLGPPGAGKTTQAHRLAARLCGSVVSIGELLRKSELEHSIATEIRSGRFVSDQLACDTLANEVRGVAGPILLDGFPRTSYQAERLGDIDPRLRGCSVVVLDVPNYELLHRLTRRSLEQERLDDEPEAIQERIRLYSDHVDAVLTRCRERGHTIFRIPGSGSADAVELLILEHLR